MSDIRKRQDADAFFSDQMKKMDGWGQHNSLTAEKRGRSINGKDPQEAIRYAQKQARKAIEWKIQDNKRRGRTYNDGKFY